MKCEICKDREASVHFKQVSNGNSREMFVCETCAAANGFDAKSPLSMADLLFGAGSLMEKQPAAPDKKCPVCGLRSRDFRKLQRLGCAACYETFSDELVPMLAAMQKGARHVGKVPAGETTNDEVAALQQALERAVAAQDFEEAAQLRDKIRALKAEVKASRETPEVRARDGG
jgi:protein arginine kinase activator